MADYSYDPDDRNDYFRDDRRDELRREQMIIAAMREIDRDQMRSETVMGQEREIQAIQEVINNPGIKMTESQKKAVNNPKKAMNNQGKIVKAPTGRQVIRSSNQFRNTGIPLPVKRTRKKTKMDKTMSRCLKIANSKLRNKNGKLKKGKTMRDVMKMAHRLCKK